MISPSRFRGVLLRRSGCALMVAAALTASASPLSARQDAVTAPRPEVLQRPPVVVPPGEGSLLSLLGGVSVAEVPSVRAGQPFTFTRTLTCELGVTTADLSVRSLSPEVTATFNPPTRVTTGGANAVFSFTAQTRPSTPSGRYTFRVRATPVSGPCTANTFEFQLDVDPPVRLVVQPGNLAVQVGKATSATVTVRRPTGFTGPVRLVATGLPDSVRAEFVPNPVTDRTASLTLDASAGANSCYLPGGCNIVIRGEAEVAVEEAVVGLVLLPDVLATVTPPSRTVRINEEATFQVALQRNGFPGSVGLKIDQVPSGAANVVSSVEPNSGTFGNELTARIALVPNTPPGTYTFRLTPLPFQAGEGKPVNVTLTLGGTLQPTVSVTPGRLAVNPGASAVYSVSIDRAGFGPFGFLRILDLPPSIAVSVDNQPPGPGGEPVSFTLTPPVGEPPAVYTLALELLYPGTEGPAVVRSNSFNLEINPPVQLLVLSASPRSVALTLGQEATVLLTVIRSNACRGMLTFFLPNGVPAGISAPAFTPTGFANRFNMTFTATSPTQGFVPLVIQAQDSDCLATPSNPETVMVQVTNPLPPPPPQIPLVVAPGGQTVFPGESAGYDLLLSRGGFLGPISFAVSGLPPGATAAIAPNPTTGNSSQLTLSTSPGTPAGSTPFTVTATGFPSGPALASAVLTVQSGGTAQPEIGGFNPISGPAGTEVEIVGANLESFTAVSFNGTPALNPRLDSAGRLRATVASGSTTGPIRVLTPGGLATSFTNFAVTTNGGPAITDFQPRMGQVGFSVTVAGAGFQGASRVTFGGVNAPDFTVVGDNFIQVFVPPGAQSGPIAVTTPSGMATSSLSFTVQ